MKPAAKELQKSCVPFVHPFVHPGVGGISYWFRFGDIMHLTLPKVQFVIGDGAAAGLPGGANVMRVAQASADSFKMMGSGGGSSIAEYYAYAAVPVSQCLGVAGK